MTGPAASVGSRSLDDTFGGLADDEPRGFRHESGANTWNFIDAQVADRPLDATSATDNVKAGALYLHYLYHLKGGDGQATAASYYQGPNRDEILPETEAYVREIHHDEWSSPAAAERRAGSPHPTRVPTRPGLESRRIEGGGVAEATLASNQHGDTRSTQHAAACASSCDCFHPKRGSGRHRRNGTDDAHAHSAGRRRRSCGIGFWHLIAAVS